jgi:NAD(P)-dependent dehydrogenase (short-subunit alcohol dehydrogenase family)
MCLTPYDSENHIMIFELTGKRALVTGAGSGIGAAIAETFARAGAHVFVTDVQTDTAAATASRITAAGGSAAPMALDVRDEAACTAMAAATGPLDVLVNNAGIGHVGTALTTTAEDLDRLYAVNVRGMLNVTKAYLPEMIARRKGAIVNMASVAGLVGIRDRLAYATTKFAVVGLTKCMALDHAADGVRVNCICPGRVETPWVAERIKAYPDPKRAYEEMAATQAMGRMGTPEEIAAAALYLASDAASFVTGSAFAIDGGWKG